MMSTNSPEYDLASLIFGVRFRLFAAHTRQRTRKIKNAQFNHAIRIFKQPDTKHSKVMWLLLSFFVCFIMSVASAMTSSEHTDGKP